MGKFTLLCLLFLSLFSAGQLKAASDSTGADLKLKECYKLNTQRNIVLINKAKALIPIAKAYPKSDFSVRVYTLVGRGFINARIMDSCNQYFRLAYNNLGPKVSVDAEAHLCLSQAFVHLLFQSYKETEVCAKRSLELYTKIDDKRGISWAKNTLADLFSNQKNYELGLKYSIDAGLLALSISDTLSYFYAISNQANMHSLLGNTKEAIEKASKVASYFRSKELYAELVVLYSNLSGWFLEISDYSNSIDASKKALRFSKMSGLNFYDDANYLNLAKAHLLKKDFKKAVFYADTSRAILKTHKNLEMRAFKCREIANVYNKLGLYAQALSCLLTYDSLNIIHTDSIFNSLFKKGQGFDAIDSKDLEIQNLKDLQKKQIQLQKAQRRILLLTLGVSIFLLLLVLLLFMFINRTTKATKDLNEKNAIINQQFDELQRQNGVQLMTIGIVGHDLRGPLSTIVRLKESMISLGTQGRIKELEEVLEAVFSNLEKILGLSNNLVDWVLSSQSGIQFKFEEVKMQVVADSIRDAFTLSLQEKNITLALDIAENASAYADLECVKTICRNLIQNAIKFTPENKQISMSAKLVKGISNQYVQIEITDEGIGIAPRILEKIKAGKNTFSSGTKGEKGSGLGLIMVQALLSMNKGTMEIVTEVGKGTTFELLIPAYNSEHAKQ
jgi:signal transduction histidine kinase